MTLSAELTSRPGQMADARGILRLRVLATTDLHAHLYPFNYYTDRRDTDVGMAGLAALIEQARAEVPNTLLLDNGDTIQGAPLGDAAIEAVLADGQSHPMIAAMNGLAYDAITPGNHDFDYGLDALGRVMEQARFPITLANARCRRTGAPAFPPHLLLERDMTDDFGTSRRLRIGIVGATPPQITQWGHMSLVGQLEMEGIVPSVKREVTALKQKGADLVIVLGHTGFGEPGPGSKRENVGHALAQLTGIDALVLGHTHKIRPGEGDEGADNVPIPVVQPGAWGSHLGIIDLDLTSQSATDTAALMPDTAPLAIDAGQWAVTGQRAYVRDARGAVPKGVSSLRPLLKRRPVFRSAMARGHRMTRAFSARPLGETAVPLETYFSLLAPCRATQVIADAQRSALRKAMPELGDLAGLPLLSAVAPFKAGGRGGPGYYTDIPVGTLMLRHAADLYLYPNGLSLVRVNGVQLRAWLERSASAFARIRPGADQPVQPLLTPDFVSYNFDRIDGLRYRIDISQPPRTNAEGSKIFDGPDRICDLKLTDGRPVTDRGVYLVITNTFRAGGGGHFPAAAAGEVVFSSPDPIRDCLAEHMSRADAPLFPKVEPTWEFEPLGGAKVCFETGPGALHHPERVAELGLRPAARTSDGFQTFELTF